MINTNSKKFNILKFIIGVLIILILLYKIDVVEIKNVLLKTDLLYIFLGLFFLFLFHLISSFTLKFLMDPLKKLDFKKWFKYYIFGYGLSLFLPGQIGEMAIPYYLSKEKIGLGKSMPIYLINKIMSFTILTILSLVGIVFLLNSSSKLLFYPILTLIIISLGIFVITSSLGRKLIKRYILKSYAKKFCGFSDTLNYLYKRQKLRIVLNFFLLIVKWIVYALFLFSLFLAMGSRVSIIIILLISAISAITGLIPLTPQGLGIRESVAVILYSQIGLNPAVVAAVYLINLLLCYLLGIISFIIYLKNPSFKIQKRYKRDMF